MTSPTWLAVCSSKLTKLQADPFLITSPTSMSTQVKANLFFLAVHQGRVIHLESEEKNILSKFGQDSL